MTEIREVDPVELIAGLSRALDLTEGEPMGHSIRSCWIGMRSAKALNLSLDLADDLFFALLLKDAGCSANAAQVSSWFGTDDRQAKLDLKRTNWSRMAEALRFALPPAALGQSPVIRLGQMLGLARRGMSSAHELVALRCTRGAQIVRALGWSGVVPEAVLNLDEHWDGSGAPRGAHGTEIPLLARILLVSQTAAIFWRRGGPDALRTVVQARRGQWFDHELVDALLIETSRPEFFRDLENVGSPHTVREYFPRVTRSMGASTDVMSIAEIFAQIVDAKSPWTRWHSMRAANYAAWTAKYMGMPVDVQESVKIAGFFHDLGKLGVSNLVLDKPGRLSAEERHHIESHPRLTYEVLKPLSALAETAYAASCHHERLDGSGYHRGLSGSAVPLEAQVVAVADVFDALTADRPYRRGLEPEAAIRILEQDMGTKLNRDAVDAIRALPFPMPMTETLGGID